MPRTGITHRVAIIQARPVYWDVDATVDLVESKTAEARSMGAQLVAFGETWLPGYPAWLDHCPGAALWDHDPTKEVFIASNNDGARCWPSLSFNPNTKRLYVPLSKAGMLVGTAQTLDPYQPTTAQSHFTRTSTSSLLWDFD